MGAAVPRSNERDGFVQVIEKPAAVAGIEPEPGLTQALVAERLRRMHCRCSDHLQEFEITSGFEQLFKPSTVTGSFSQTANRS